MNPKNTSLLAAFAVALFVYIFFFDRHAPKPASADRTVLPDLRSNAVTSIQIQWTNQFAIRADRTNNGWQLSRPLACPAQSVAIERLLHALEKLTYHTYITAEELQDRPKADAEFGFNTPLVTLIVRQGRETQIKLGSLTAPGDEIYLQVVGMAGNYTVGTDLFQYIPRRADDLRERTFANLAQLPLDRVIVATGPKVESQMVEFRRDAAEELWQMSAPLNKARVDNPRLEELLANLEMLQITQFVTDEPGADLEQFGLQPPQLELTLNHGTNVLSALQFGKSPTNDSNLVYARHTGSRSVVLVPRAPVEGWRGQYTSFRDRHLVGAPALASDRIEVHAEGGEKFTLQKQTNELWRVIEPANYPADEQRMAGFLEALARLEIEPVNGQFAAKENVPPSDLATNYGLAKPVRQYVLQRRAAGSGARGSLTNAGQLELDFGKVTGDKGLIYARRPDESSVYAVKLDDFNRLPASAIRMRDRRVWKFGEDDVKTVTLRQAGQAQTITRRGLGDYVIAKGSQGIVNPSAMDAGVDELGALTAENWVDRGEQNRAAYGFSEKATQISLELAGAAQPQVVTLELGGWSPGGLRYGGVRLDGQFWTFEMPKRAYVMLISCFPLNEPLAP